MSTIQRPTAAIPKPPLTKSPALYRYNERATAAGTVCVEPCREQSTALVRRSVEYRSLAFRISKIGPFTTQMSREALNFRSPKNQSPPPNSTSPSPIRRAVEGSGMNAIPTVPVAEANPLMLPVALASSTELGTRFHSNCVKAVSALMASRPIPRAVVVIRSSKRQTHTLVGVRTIGPTKRSR